MLRNTIYYNIKPFLPQWWRTMLRRTIVERQRNRFENIWPIMPGSEREPEGWPGWPDGKKFAIVLTHDVEDKAGLGKCQPLMQLEIELGFRSSFNFIPEGKYRVSAELREDLDRNGFEVCVHDLKHDGRLFRSAGEFKKRAVRINHYLRKWNAVGFRSGFMLHNLDWLHQLEIEYDMSTFDTDPFEPQPEGRHTIFPLWIPAPAAGPPKAGNQKPEASARTSHEPTAFGSRHPQSALALAPGETESPDARSGGYVELPYTLPQDSTLFLFLRERSIDIWKKKVDWIVEQGGMILLDTHPDYMTMAGGKPGRHEYPAEFYRHLLEYIRSKYRDSYWHALPRQMASWIRSIERQKAPDDRKTVSYRRPALRRRPKIWIDLDNTPHVPFFEPIADELRSRGFPLLVTARDAFQVCELADKKGLQYVKIGRHHGKNPAFKAAGLLYRSLQLAPLVLREKPALGISHGARAQLILGNLLRLPTVLIEDYEHCKFPVTMRPSWVIAPKVIPDGLLPLRNGHVRKYDGIKEDVYAWKLVPDRQVLDELGLSDTDLVVTVRPPATEAHYHNPESERLFEKFMERACRTPGVRVVLLPRNKKQAARLEALWPGWFEGGRAVVPAAALDGLNLLWHSDLVVSGGGTMNREAAALSVPVYSLFRGSIGAVDHNLSNEGRLVLIESVEDVEKKILLAKRPRKLVTEVTSRKTLHDIVDQIDEIAERYRPSL